MKLKEIRGAGGGGGDQHTPHEADDTLFSSARINIIDLLGEGEIGGLVSGAKSIYLNDTPIQNADGTSNFSITAFQERKGTQAQAPIWTDNAIGSPRSIGSQIKRSRPFSFSIQNPLATSVMVVMTIPQLIKQESNGDTNGASVSYKFELSINGGAYSEIGTFETIGKTRARYQRSHFFMLPTGTERVIRVTRLTDDSNTQMLSNDTYLDSVIERIDTVLSYPNSALIGITIDAEQFSSIPSRSYLVDGLYIRVPSNYDAKTRTYSGVWDGTFKMAVSGNPAWVMYDVLTSKRYGLGQYILPSQVDTAALYKIGRYCDELVEDGMGGYEPRFTINTIINTLTDAYKLIGYISSVFRGMGFWSGNGVSFTCDAPADPVMVFNQANVIGGSFNYVGSARKDRHSVALITWNDPEDNYKQKIEYVEDREMVEQFGIRKTDMVAFGCTSRAQAHRVGLWILYTERYESQAINFSVGIDSAMLMPGEIIQIHDSYRAGKRMGGRVKSATLTSAELDAPITLESTYGVLFVVRLPDGSFAERTLSAVPGSTSTVHWEEPLPDLPLNGAIFIVSEPSLSTMLARVIGISQGKDPGTFTVTAVEHNPSKFGMIEKGYCLEERPVSILNAKVAKDAENLVIAEEQYEVYPSTIGTKLHVSWTGYEASYELSYRRAKDQNWTTLTTSYQSIEIENARKDTYEFSLRSVNALGKKSPGISSSYLVLGKTYAPGDVTGFVVQKRITDLLLTWNAVSDVDISGYEIRQGGSWDQGTVVMQKFMGTSFIHDQSEKGVYPYHIRSIDSAGNYSENVASYTLVLDAPAVVEQFNCVTSGGRIEFRWRPNQELDITGYEIREGSSWALGVKLCEVTATSFSIPAGSATNRTFWIKAIAAPGIYSQSASMTTVDVATPSNVNRVASRDLYALGFPGVKHFLGISGDDLQMSTGSQYAEYVFENNLPSSYLGNNTMFSGAESVTADAVTWATANFSWNDPAANRPWIEGGISEDSITVRYQISPYTGMLANEFDGWGFDGTVASVKGSATAVESSKVTYAPGRYKSGVQVSDLTRLSWSIAMPANFSKTFWVNPTRSEDATYLTLSSGSSWLRLNYSKRDQTFRLRGSDGKTIEVQWPLTIGTPVFIGISQTATTRRLLISEIGSSEIGMNEVQAAPIATYTKVALY